MFPLLFGCTLLLLKGLLNLSRGMVERIGIEDCCSFCLLDLLVFIALGHMNMFGCALTCEEKLWFDAE